MYTTIPAYLFWYLCMISQWPTNNLTICNICVWVDRNSTGELTSRQEGMCKGDTCAGTPSVFGLLDPQEDASCTTLICFCKDTNPANTFHTVSIGSCFGTYCPLTLLINYTNLLMIWFHKFLPWLTTILASSISDPWTSLFTGRVSRVAFLNVSLLSCWVFLSKMISYFFRNVM